MMHSDEEKSPYAGIGVTKLETMDNSEVENGPESPKKSYQTSN